MDKKELIDNINIKFKENLKNSSMSYSRINKSKAVWWFNIRFSKFAKNVHLLLNSKDHVL